MNKMQQSVPLIALNIVFFLFFRKNFSPSTAQERKTYGSIFHLLHIYTSETVKTYWIRKPISRTSKAFEQEHGSWKKNYVLLSWKGGDEN